MNILGFSVSRVRKPDLGLYSAYPRVSLVGRRFINIGAGGFIHPYWTNIDHGTAHYEGELAPFVEHDLMRLEPLPFESDSVEAAYMSHVAEHISNEAAQVCFNEVRRVLKPGGVFRLTGPDALLAYRAWRRNDRGFFYSLPSYEAAGYLSCPADEATLPQMFLFEFSTELSTLSRKRGLKIHDEEVADAFDGGATADAFHRFTDLCQYDPDYAGYHINWWTPEKAGAMLRLAGFRQYRSSGYGQSQCPPMRDLSLFDGTHPKLSFYAEATK